MNAPIKTTTLTEMRNQNDVQLEPQEISVEVLQEKYAKGDEKTIQDVRRRVAKALANNECAHQDLHEKTFFQTMEAGFVPAGRINSAAGMELSATLINCFVQSVGDCITGVDDFGRPSIYTALAEAAETMRRGGGVGYNFGHIRPSGALVKGTMSRASGPLSYMQVFDRSCETVESAGYRRGSQMGILPIDHPDIEAFIHAKDTRGTFNNFNLSIGVSDKFMNAVKHDLDWALVHAAEPQREEGETDLGQDENGKYIYRIIRARDLWKEVMVSTYDHAEPGIVFLDKMNGENNLWYCEHIEATNPCVTGDTLILTDDGYRRIDSLVDQDVTVWNGYEWSPTVPRITGQNQEIIDFEFSDGSKLSCTPYHKFVLHDNTRVEARQLHTGMKLAKYRFPIISSGVEVETKYAYTQGFYSGDGQVNTKRIWLYEEKCNLIPYLSLSAYSDQSSSSSNKRIMATLDRIPESKCFVPSTDYSIQTRLDWLAGLIDSDGSLIDGCGIHIWSVNRDFLLKIKFMLNTIGVSGAISLGRKEGMKSLPDGKGSIAKYNCQDCWRIYISGSDVIELIELGLVTHRIKVNSIPNRNAARFISVTFKQKRETLEPFVYCFTEEKNNTGIFNGIMTAQCAEEPLPPYGCCCLGSINLTKYVENAFSAKPVFNEEKYKQTITQAIRMLDNVLDLTQWPLEKQQQEAMNKRRIGLGFLGLGDAMVMMGIRYDSKAGEEFAAYVTEMLRDTAYRASIELAKEKGAFPLFDKEKYLAGKFISRLPEDIRDDIREHGIRNSHLLSIAPTGTISLAFADNASGGLEPAFSWVYDRKKRQDDGTMKSYEVADHSWRLYRAMGGDVGNLPGQFVSALEMSVGAHVGVMKAIQPFIDTSLSKCVAKGTRIMTNKGLLKVEDLGEAVEADTFAKPLDDLMVLCPDGAWRKVTQHYYGGVKDTVKVRLSNGQIIEGSEVHRLMAIDGWTQMSELEHGDLIKIKRDTRLSYKGGELGPNSALFLGMMCADGHLQEVTGHVGITKNNDDVGALFTTLAKQLFGVEVKHTVDARNGVHSWYFLSRSVCRWVKTLIGYRSYDKHVPEQIFSGSPEEMRAFLKGLSLGGYRITDGGTLSTCVYCGRSQELATGAFSLLKALGHAPRGGFKKVAGYDYQVYWTAAKGIDFCIENHKNSTGELDNELIEIPEEVYRVDFYYAKVVDIQQSQNEIYDIEVEGTHDYLIDGVISHNTVNIPVDYPFEDFQNLYMEAWEAGLKGLATYRPNSTLGSVLSVKEEPKTEEVSVVPQTGTGDPGKTLEQIVDEMYVQAIESRDSGTLYGISSKGSFHTDQGKQKFIITINFTDITRDTPYGRISIQRPIEFLLTSNFAMTSSSWAAAMRNISLAARYGAPMSKIIENLQEISWDHGNIRYGLRPKGERMIPMWHSSDAAVLGFVIEEELKKYGYLDAEGNVIKMYSFESISDAVTSPTAVLEVIQPASTVKKVSSPVKSVMSGKKCEECGAMAVVKRDGCSQCDECGNIGACG